MSQAERPSQMLKRELQLQKGYEKAKVGSTVTQRGAQLHSFLQVVLIEKRVKPEQKDHSRAVMTGTNETVVDSEQAQLCCFMGFLITKSIMVCR